MRTLFIAIAVLQCGLNTFGQVDASVSLPKTEFLIGEPIRLEIVLTNPGTKSIRMGLDDLNSECTPYTVW
jgi:hypothetical protein